MDSYSVHFNISSALYFIMQAVVLVACIVIAQKKKSIATTLLLTGAILNILTKTARYFIATIVELSGQDDVMLTHVILSYTGNIAYLIFGLGLLQFALNDLTEDHNYRSDNSHRRDDRFRRP